MISINYFILPFLFCILCILLKINSTQEKSAGWAEAETITV